MRTIGNKDYEFGDEIRLWSEFVHEDAIRAVAETLRSGWINTGKKEKELREKAMKKWGFPYCVACNNGTAALRTALAVLGVGPGDEVISTPYTFIATNTAGLEQGARPVFADINYDDLNINPQSIEKQITPKTKAIMIVHYGGNPCDLDEIRAIGIKHALPVIEDAAHALGSMYKGKYIGSTGDIICFSLQVVKIITAGDGGLISTTREEWYQELKKTVWYGIDRDAKRNNLLDPLPDNFKGDTLGFKYNMNDIAASIAGANIDHFDEAIGRRREIGTRYRRELAGCKKIKLMDYKPDREPNYQIFPIHVSGRQTFAEHMWKHKIMVNVNNRRNDRYPMFGGTRNDLPNLARAEEDVILLPIHYDLTDEHVGAVIDVAKDYDTM